MIVVDSRVWIDFLNERNAPHVAALRATLGTDEIIVGDLMLCEVLQGLANERAAQQVEELLRRFEIVAMAGEAIAVRGRPQFPFSAETRHYRPQEHRPLDRNLVHREPKSSLAQ